MNIARKKRWILVFALLLGVFMVNAQNTCTIRNTPELIFPSYLQINEGEEFFLDINVSNNTENVIFSWAPINLSLLEFNINQNSGYVSFTPSNNDPGLHTLFVIATTSQACFDMEQLSIKIFDRPKFTGYLPKELEKEVSETQTVRFYVNASTSISEPLKYTWYHNNDLIKEDTQKYILFTNYSDSGRHRIKIIATDARGLNSSLEWDINVKDKNRGPFVKYQIPNMIVGEGTDGEIFNMYSYIFDPDGDELKFEVYSVVENDVYTLKNDTTIFDIYIDNLGDFFLKNKAEIFFKEYIRIKAIDTSGMSVLSNPFFLRLATAEDAVEVLQKKAPEKCDVDIECGEWTACLPTNIMTRTCNDINKCNEEDTDILEYKDCDYNATCEDGLLNQGEKEVDCGGPCDFCPTCFDGVLNQGEEKVDCGGPCNPCPTCFDIIKNQDETDTDCGGSCSPCADGLSCNIHTDCESFVCRNSTCADSSCNDFRQNQGEQGIDCGGPCKPCETCFDNVLNQGEEEVDCGGPCKSCISCHDGIRNQGEFFKDCGGPCDSCLALTILGYAKYLLLLIPIIFVFIYIGKIQRSSKVMVKLFSFMPVKLPSTSNKVFIDTKNKLNHIRTQVFAGGSSKQAADDYVKTLHDFLGKMFEIEGNVSKGVLKSKSRAMVKNPYLAKMFIQIFDYSSSLSSPEAPLFKMELNEKIDSCIGLMNDIQEYA